MATTTIQKGQPGSRARFRDSYLLHKLHSLTGIVPIGAFMVFHLVANSYSLRGEAEFNTTVKTIGYAPFVGLLEIVAIAVPILFHAIYGLFLVAEMEGPGGNVAHYGYTRNWLYWLQRVSGVLALAYLLFHTVDTSLFKRWWDLTASPEMGFQSISYAAMAYRFTQGWYLAFYLVGIAAASFHLGNGLFNFSIRWGIAIGKEAQRIAAGLGWAVGLGLTVLGCWIAIHFALVGQQYKGYASLEALIKAQAAKAAPAAEGK